MAVKLERAVRRQMLSQCREGRYRGNHIIVELLPGDLIAFRIKGTRQRFELSLQSCYSLAVELESKAKKRGGVILSKTFRQIYK